MTNQDRVVVPAEVMADWQAVVDLMAELVGVPAGLIMRVDRPDIEVLVSSQSQGNPYHPGDREHLEGSGLYCETVIRTRQELLVPDALADPDWRENPDVKLDMISYLGLPILLPDGVPFGTICILDNKANAFSETYRRLVAKFRDLVQSQLGLVYMNQVLEGRNQSLMDFIDEIKILRGVIPICASCKKIRDRDDYWQQLEEYITAHSEAEFTHSLCPECAEKLYPELLGKGEKKH